MIRRGSVRVGRELPARLAAAIRAAPEGVAGWAAELLVRERAVALPTTADRTLVHDLIALRLVARVGDRLEPRARVDIVRNLVVASDMRRHRRAPDFVVGPGPASFTLARHVRPHPGGRLLDLGSGSGIQGLLLAGPSDGVVAIDISPRAVAFTALNAGINGRRRVRAQLGDFLGDEPDRALDGRFETVVANPPFVLAPSRDLVYRDRPLPGDEVGARTVERVARALTPGGRGYVLCNWIDRGGDPDGPARAWARDAGANAAVTRLGTLDPSAYAATWTRDLPEAERPAAATRWARALRTEGIERVHVGVVELRRRHARWPAMTSGARRRPAA